MRPPEEVKQELVGQWLDKAEEDLAVIEHLTTENTAHLPAIGFHAQQAVEKFLKAFLVYHQVEFPKTHDIDEILGLVATIDVSLAESLRESISLTPYGVEIRYPSDFPEMTPEDAREAMKLAAKTRDAIRSALKSSLEKGSSDA